MYFYKAVTFYFILFLFAQCSYEQNLDACYKNNQCNRADFNCIINYRAFFPESNSIPPFCLLQTKKCKDECHTCADEIRYTGKTAEFCYKNKYRIANGFNQ